MSTRAVLVVFLALSAVIVAVFTWVGLSTRRSQDVDYSATGRLRQGFFLGLMAAIVLVLALTLPRMPYPAEAATPQRVVHVTGRQYAFALGDSPVTDPAAWEEGRYSASVDVNAGETVEFRVTTVDVNHGFSLFSPDGELVAQTQAMPGYVNRLRLRLDRPGTYAVLCLEYCGLGHHRMRGTVVVR